MGIWEWIGSTAEAVKRNAPDPTPVKDACRNIYTNGGAASTKIDQAVNGVGKWMPDDETKSKIGIYTTIFANNAAAYACKEGYKFIPGGDAISNIVTKTIDDVKYENLKVEQVKPSGSAEKQLSGNGGEGLAEDVIGVFMKKEFFGNRFFDDLMVSNIPRK